MESGNILGMILIAALLFVMGYGFLAKVIGAIAVLAGLISMGSGGSSSSSSKSSSKSNSKPGKNIMKPIEVESKWKPQYRIPKDMVMKVGSKSPKESSVSRAMKASPLGWGAYLLGKKLSD